MIRDDCLGQDNKLTKKVSMRTQIFYGTSCLFFIETDNIFFIKTVMTDNSIWFDPVKFD